jgi:hypothetical protein
VGDAEVFAEAGGDASSRARARGRTDPHGDFVLTGLPLGFYDLRVEAPGLPPALLRGVEADTQGGTSPVRVTLGEGATVDVQVVDEARRGVRAAGVWVTATDGTPLHDRAWSTGPNGRLRIQGVPSGGARLKVHAVGFGRPEPLVLDLADGETREVIVVLRPAGALSVAIVGYDRSAVARARVSLLRARTGEVVDARRALVRLDRWSGAFHMPRTGLVVIPDLEDGLYDLDVDGGPGWLPARVPVRVRSRALTEVTVTLTRP